MKKIAFLVISIAILLLLFGCVQKLPDNNTGTTPPGSQQDNNGGIPTDQNNPITDQNTPANPILSAEQECNQKPTAVQRDLCLRGKASLSLKNIYLCDKLSTLSRDDCLSRAAVALNDYETCGKIASTKIADDCYNTVAKNAGGYLPCTRIVDETLMANCLATAGKADSDIEACKLIPETTHALILLRDDCVKSVALSKKDYALCELISPSITSGVMNKDNCFYGIAQSLEDKSICNKIFDKNLFDDCIGIVAVGLSNANYCTEINDLNKETHCIKTIATETSNASYCSLISDKNESDNCKNSLLSSNTSILVCETFLDSGQRENCLFEYAKNFEAEECQAAIDANTSENCYNACKKIRIDEEQADDCYYEIAKKLEKVSYCYDIRSSNVYTRNDCFDAVATATLDSSLCSNIFNTAPNYAGCFAHIAVNVSDPLVCDLATRDYFAESYSSKNWCLYYYADGTGNVNDCNRIKDPNFLKVCIADVNGT